MKAIFLTGASGVVGQTLVHHLRGATLFCLVRKNAIAAPHVISMEGDITRRRLGLTHGEYNEVAGRISAVVHAAANTSFEPGLDAAIMQTNVDGTRHALELADTANVPFYYISTAFTLTRSGAEAVGPNAYEVSKCKAEQIVSTSGLPNVIIRPSIIVGDHRTGAISRLQGFHNTIGLLLKGLLPFGPADAESYVDFISCDQVARMIAGIVERGETAGEYWLTMGERALRLGHFVDLCIENGGRLTGKKIKRPRPVQQEAFDRLFRPVFLPALPADLRNSLERAMQMARYLHIDQPFPTSVEQLSSELGLGPIPSPETTLIRNLEWLVGHSDVRRRLPEAGRAVGSVSP